MCICIIVFICNFHISTSICTLVSRTFVGFCRRFVYISTTLDVLPLDRGVESCTASFVNSHDGIHCSSPPVIKALKFREHAACLLQRCTLRTRLDFSMSDVAVGGCTETEVYDFALQLLILRGTPRKNDVVFGNLGFSDDALGAARFLCEKMTALSKPGQDAVVGADGAFVLQSAYLVFFMQVCQRSKYVQYTWMMHCRYMAVTRARSIQNDPERNVLYVYYRRASPCCVPAQCAQKTP